MFSSIAYLHISLRWYLGWYWWSMTLHTVHTCTHVGSDLSRILYFASCTDIHANKFDLARIVPWFGSARKSIGVYCSRRNRSTEVRYTPRYFAGVRGKSWESGPVHLNFRTLARTSSKCSKPSSNSPELRVGPWKFASVAWSPRLILVGSESL